MRLREYLRKKNNPPVTIFNSVIQKKVQISLVILDKVFLKAIFSFLLNIECIIYVNT